jgi:hypothetical protein
MKSKKIFSFFVLLFLLAISNGNSIVKPPLPPYPKILLKELGSDNQDIIKENKKFRNDPIHVHWMLHVQEVLPQIDHEKEESIVNVHTSLLCIKDKLDGAYFKGKITKKEHATRLGELMKWFQQANRTILTEEEYNSLFEVSGKEEEFSSKRLLSGELGFPIYNPVTTVDKVKAMLDDDLITELNHFYQDQSRELRDIKIFYETKDFRKITKEQVEKEIEIAEADLKANFQSYCRRRLTDEQFILIFGSQKNM